MKRAILLGLLPSILTLVVGCCGGGYCGTCGGHRAVCDSQPCGGYSDQACGECAQPCDCGGVHVLAPFRWVLRVLGASCPCGGCGNEVYYGEYGRCYHEHCGCEGGYVSGPAQGPAVPYSGAPQIGPDNDCHCQHGHVQRSTNGAGKNYASQPVNGKGQVVGSPRVLSVTDGVATPADNSQAQRPQAAASRVQ